MTEIIALIVAVTGLCTGMAVLLGELRKWRMPTSRRKTISQSKSSQQ